MQCNCDGTKTLKRTLYLAEFQTKLFRPKNLLSPIFSTHLLQKTNIQNQLTTSQIWICREQNFLPQFETTHTLNTFLWLKHFSREMVLSSMQWLDSSPQLAYIQFKGIKFMSTFMHSGVCMWKWPAMLTSIRHFCDDVYKQSSRVDQHTTLNENFTPATTTSLGTITDQPPTHLRDIKSINQQSSKVKSHLS